MPIRRRSRSLKKSRSNAGRLALVGIGSDLFGDDAAGVIVAQRFAAALKRSRSSRLRAFDGGTAPENLTGEIIRFLSDGKSAASDVILVDVADLGLPPGATRILSLQALESVSFGTHRLPLHMLADYLVQRAGCDHTVTVTVIAIQPKFVGFNKAMSSEVTTAARSLVEKLKDGTWKEIEKF